VIPNSVTLIENQAFEQGQFTSLTLGNGLTSIGDQVFYRNYGIRINSITFGTGLTSIGYAAFQNFGVDRVTIPEGVTTLAERAFDALSTRTLILPNSLTTITAPVAGVSSGTFAGGNFGIVKYCGSSTTVRNYPFNVPITCGAVVDFDPNLGSGSMSPQTSSTDTTLRSNTFTRTGYVFQGWNTQSNGLGTTYLSSDSFPFSTSPNRTLYAKWLPICDGSTPCAIGDIGPGGGVIFYVASGFFTQLGATAGMCTTNCKYLEAAPTTGTTNWTDNNYAWSGNTNTLIGASAQGSAIGTGYQNTLAIVGQSGAGTSGAASVTRAYRGPNNKTDWFLPSKDELHQMRLQRAFVAAPPVGAAHSNYWTSTEDSDTAAIYEYFLFDDHYTPYDKSHAIGIFARPVRAFGPAPIIISAAEIAGVTAPVTGATPVTTVAPGTGYTGTVAWSGSPTTFAAVTTYTATITLTASAGYTLSGVSVDFFTVAGATSVANSANSGVITAVFPATAAPTSTVVYVAPTPVPYLKTLATPKLNLKDGKLICTPGTYNAGYTLDGVVQGGSTSLFTPSTFTYNLLINGVAQTSLSVTSSTALATWTLSTSTSGSLLSCSVTVSANGVTNTDKSTDNTSALSSATSTLTTSTANADAAYAAAQSANSKAYQKALVDNRAKWRTEIAAIRTNYYDTVARINAQPKSAATNKKMITDKSKALKVYIAAQKKSAADYKASQPAAAAARDTANKAALDAKNTAIAKANAAYGTFIESIGYGVLIP
jgi:uncharacterized repeat protein (TIGR02543 family)